jgi:signal transduction histidine kinase
VSLSSKVSRTVVFRLTLFYSLFFALCVVMLLGFVYWKTAREMNRRVDQILTLEKRHFAELSQDRLPEEIERSVARDQRHVYIYGLFSPEGHVIAGNMDQLPGGIPMDGKIYQVDLLVRNIQADLLPSRVMIHRLGTGEWLLLGHDVKQLIEFGDLMKIAFAWGGSLTILLGLMFGMFLSSRPLSRIEQIQKVCERIMLGDIRQRLPVGKRSDELDMLAAIVNRMLDEIERLMSEIKGAGDNIAHDLRTPLTRLRVLLHRVQQQLNDAPAQRTMVDQAVTEVDSLLLRFRALLRISEIENKQRRAGFKNIRLQDILEQAVSLIAPLAEEKSIRLSMKMEQVERIHGDGELLVEAMINLLDNAIKFTPADGRVEVRLTQDERGPRIDIIDSGIGIRDNEKVLVMNRFYRSENDLNLPGYGLGLAIVMAIIKLHGYGLELGDAGPGTRVTIFCWPHSL